MAGKNKKQEGKRRTGDAPVRAGVVTPVEDSPRGKAGAAPGGGATAASETKSGWKSWYSWALLAALVLGALLPVSNRAFHIDDTLFMYAGKHIVEEPLNPFGFRVNWDDFVLPMSKITRNPPLACYYIAVVGSVSGWSERAMHIAFLLPALAGVLLTFFVARRFTRSPLLAALAAIAAPAYLVSAASVMCDVMTVALWMAAIALWVEGMDRAKPWLLAGSGVLVGAAALTKYFGVSLIPLLLAYTLYRKRSASRELLYLLIPVGILAAYQMWTTAVYGEGLLFAAAAFASEQSQSAGVVSETIQGLSFFGGCILPALTFAPLLWSWRQILAALAVGAAATALVVTGTVYTGLPFGETTPVGIAAFHAHRFLFSLELTLFIAGGISALGLAVADFLEHKDSNAALLMLWVIGTFAFTCYFNWTVNARSVLPAIPAVGILIARRLRTRSAAPGTALSLGRVLAPLLVSGVISVWVLAGDTQLANSARTAAYSIQKKTGFPKQKMWFIGHWGFQYYMEQLGAYAADSRRNEFADNDYVFYAQNNTADEVKPQMYIPHKEMDFAGPTGAITINNKVGAGFYSAFWGPLPYFLGPIPAEHYTLFHLVRSGE